MKRIITVLSLIAGMLVPAFGATVLVAGPASARCVPPGNDTTIFSFSKKVYSYQPTAVKSDWVWPKRGDMTITYNQTKSYTNTASVTATVSAEAGVIFAKASTSLGVSVGRSWGQSKSWSYSAHVAKNAKHKYRLHLYHQAVSFSVMEKHWNFNRCNWDNAWKSWQPVKHAPLKNASRNVWRIDQQGV